MAQIASNCCLMVVVVDLSCCGEYPVLESLCNITLTGMRSVATRLLFPTYSSRSFVANMERYQQLNAPIDFAKNKHIVKPCRKMKNCIW